MVRQRVKKDSPAAPQSTASPRDLVSGPASEGDRWHSDARSVRVRRSGCPGRRWCLQQRRTSGTQLGGRSRGHLSPVLTEDRRPLVASNEKPLPVNATEALERLGRMPLHESSMEALLQTVADLAKTVTPGNPEASVTLLVNDNPRTVVSTGQLAVDLDETQYERGHGPCLHAARSGELTEIADTRTETRWRDYAQRAVQRGNLSSLS